MDPLPADERTSQEQAEYPPTGHATLSEEQGASDKAAANGNSEATDEHQFQKAISAWRSIDLGGLVPQLDTTAAEIVENQRESLVQRKELAQKTKDFRKLDDTAKLGEFKVLLKAYQTFVDLLTSHGKTTSSAFLQLYSTVSEAPDPYPLLEASVDSLLLSEDTLPKLTSENEHLQTMVRNLTQDLERAEARFKQETTLRKQLEESREAKAKEIEASWQAVLDEKKDNWEAKERALEDKIENQDRLFNEIKASYEVSKRLGHDGTDGAERHDPTSVSASAAELEIVSSDLERTSQRLAEVEARNEQLRVELAQASADGSQRTNIKDDPEFSRLQSENGSLLRKLERAKFDGDSTARKCEAQVRGLEREVQSLSQEREELREKTYQWRDYADIKRELEVFKAIEFAAAEDDDNDNDNDNDDGSGTTATANRTPSSKHRRGSSINGSAAKKDSLEQLLLARNKKLSSEMAMLRVSHQELQREMEALQRTTESTSSELERTRGLNATLENELLTLQQEASNQVSWSGGRSVVSSRYYPATSPYGTTASRTRKSSPTSSIISGIEPSSGRGGIAETSPLEPPGSAMGGGSGILPMVQAQRDRFKQRNSQLETELQKQYSIVSSLRSEVASLQKDNLNLYEKTRYASTYQRSNAHQQYAPGSMSSAHDQIDSMTMQAVDSRSPGSLSSPPPPPSSSMDRYRSAYEANISPFAAFRGREAARAYRRLSAPERAVYALTRLVLANRTSRNLFAGYCVALHVLVLLMLYWMHGLDLSRHASRLGEAAVAVGTAAGGAGMADAAGERGGGGGAGDAHHGEWRQEGLDGGKPS